MLFRCFIVVVLFVKYSFFESTEKKSVSSAEGSESEDFFGTGRRELLQRVWKITRLGRLVALDVAK